MYVKSGARLGIVCRERLRVLLPILVGVWLSACATVGGGPSSEASDDSGALVIENNSWSAVTVYLLASGQPWRLGSVESASARSFALDQHRYALSGRDVYLIARPLAGQPFHSDAFVIPMGRTTVWRIENATAMSTLLMR
jgi:hypothetical protein